PPGRLRRRRAARPVHRARVGRAGAPRGDRPRRWRAMKTMVCACEDVTAGDVGEAIAKGYRDIESVKRYTGFGTGMCQGKQCHATVASLLAKTAHAKSEHVLPFTPRPPLNPTELSYWASAPTDPTQHPTSGVPAALGVTPGVHPL